MKEEFTVCVLSRSDVEALGYDPNSLTDAEMERLATKMGDAYVENGFWVDLGIYLEHFGAAKFDEFNSHAVFEMMFEDDDYDRLRNKFGYKNEDIDVDELYNTGKTTWHTDSGDYCLEYESNNVIKIKIYNINNPDKYCESFSYEEGNISCAFAESLASILKQYSKDFFNS